ncbi:uncharacterized protein [Diadema setosum]|uniref:uncharacterized protein n=1 Tax=Diadema setosum TaxID=31175 RepID=UPI003B3B113C
MTREILEACDERRKLKMTKFQDENSKVKYQKANAKVKKEIRTAKDNFLREKCQQMQQAFENNNSKKVFDTIKEIHRKAAIKTPAIEAANGLLLTDENRTQEPWTEYVKHLYNHPIQTDDSVLRELEAGGPGIVEDEELEILRSEVVGTVTSLKSGKAPGVDNIPTEMLKEEEAADMLHKLCNLIWRTGEWPKQWTQSLIVPLPKKKAI